MRVVRIKESTKKFDLSWLISMSKGQLKVNEEDSLVFFIVELQFNFYIYLGTIHKRRLPKF